MTFRAASSLPRYVSAALVAVVAAVHFQQYVDFMSEVPTVGVLFLLNAAGGAAIAVTLGRSEPAPLHVAAALAGLGLVIGSLLSIAVALGGTFFGYQEPTLRLPIVVAIAAEIGALPALTYCLVSAARRRPRARPARPSEP